MADILSRLSKIYKDSKMKKPVLELESMKNILELAIDIKETQTINSTIKKSMGALLLNAAQQRITEHDKILSQFGTDNRDWEKSLNVENMLNNIIEALKDKTYKHELYDVKSPKLYVYKMLTKHIEKQNDQYMKQLYINEQLSRQSSIVLPGSALPRESAYRGDGGNKTKKDEKTGGKTTTKKDKKAPRKITKQVKKA